MKKPILLATCIALSCVQGTAAGPVYQWLDGNGKTHYGDRPGQAHARRLNIENQPEKPFASRKNNGLQKTERLLEAWTEERRQRRQKRAREQAELAELETKCRRARQYQKDVNRASLIYREDDDGKRSYLSDAEREGQLRRAREMVDHYCG